MEQNGTTLAEIEPPTLQINSPRQDVSGARDRIDRLLETIQGLPSAPEILMPLLHALGEEETNLSRVTDMIQFDPALTAKLLNTCNSAFFGVSVKIDSVSDAIQRLGFRTVYSIVAAAAGGTLFAASGPTVAELGAKWWRHAVMTAFAAQFVAEDIGAETGTMFTAGLLHDLGQIVLLREFKSDYTRVLAEADAEGASLLELEKVKFGVNHVEIGRRLLERWKFSPAIVAAVGFHNDPAQAGDSELQRLAACLHLANELARSLESGKGKESLLEIQRVISFSILDRTWKDISLYYELIAENMNYVEAMCRLN